MKPIVRDAPMICVVSATRFSEADFWTRSALGLSLKRLEFDPNWRARIAFDNRLGLPEVFNPQIESAEPGEILVFIHDDVWLDDTFFMDRLREGLRHYDVLGVAGNRRRVAGQPSWASADGKTWDAAEYLSGIVAHGEQALGKVEQFGPVPADCELLDGVLLAANVDDLREQALRFDPRFDFHFYDIDFCRSARRAGLRLGTWPISLTHQSSGGFHSDAWRSKLAAYLEKWGD